MSVSILVAEDHAMVREALCVFLTHSGFEVVGEACDGEEAVRLAAQLKPEIALMDISMPRLNGIDASREIGHLSPGTRCILLTMHSEDRYIREAARAGVAGYVLKSRTAEDLATAVRDVCAGGVHLSPGLPREAFEAPMRMTPSALETLSAREQEVLQLVAQGKSTKEIAAQLGIGSRTVECHRANAMSKLGVHDIAGVVRYAVSSGLIDA